VVFNDLAKLFVLGSRRVGPVVQFILRRVVYRVDGSGACEYLLAPTEIGMSRQAWIRYKFSSRGPGVESMHERGVFGGEGGSK
jgi:hypothetical protein